MGRHLFFTPSDPACGRSVRPPGVRLKLCLQFGFMQRCQNVPSKMSRCVCHTRGINAAATIQSKLSPQRCEIASQVSTPPFVPSASALNNVRHWFAFNQRQESNLIKLPTMHSRHVRFLNNPLQFKIKNQNAVRRLMLLLYGLACATRACWIHSNVRGGSSTCVLGFARSD